MGLRGYNSEVTALRDARRNAAYPGDQLTPKGISPEAISIYKKMRRLEPYCDCPQPYSVLIPRCRYCDQFWKLNAKLAGCLGLFPGLLCYENPEWRNRRAFQDDIDRFHLLEAAVAAEKKQRKHRYKWQK